MNIQCLGVVYQAAFSDKTFNMTIVYGVFAMLAFLLAIGYCWMVKKRNKWLIGVYLSVFVVNMGYFMLAVSKTLDGALFANRIAYLGSVFLPFLMLLTIMDICGLHCKKWLMIALCGVSVIIFLIAATPGYLDWYYKEVVLVTVNGMSKLQKVYGPLHILYLPYLILYFAGMIGVIVYAGVKKKIKSFSGSVMLLAVVMLNIAVWFIEQLINWDFEFLSITYIISELFLLLICGMQQEYSTLMERLRDTDVGEMEQLENILPPDVEELFGSFAERAASLTATERRILRYYAEGKEIAEVAELAFISIYTVRKHNANIYHKLEVGSRDELMLYLDLFRRLGRLDEIC